MGNMNLEIFLYAICGYSNNFLTLSKYHIYIIQVKFKLLIMDDSTTSKVNNAD